MVHFLFRSTNVDWYLLYARHPVLAACTKSAQPRLCLCDFIFLQERWGNLESNRFGFNTYHIIMGTLFKITLFLSKLM